MSCQFLPSGPNDGRKPPAGGCLVTAAAPGVACCGAEGDQSPLTIVRQEFEESGGSSRPWAKGSLAPLDEIGEDHLFGKVDEALEAARQRLQPAGV
jgi:hypothetical protein